MKIISMDPARTQNPQDIAFNVQGELDEEVLKLARVNLVNVTLRIEGDVLRVKANLGPIDVSLIQILNEALEVATARKKDDDEQVARRRQRMLDSLKTQTGLEFK